MRQTKYITSGGLAFSEDKDMEKLRRFSLKGWHVSDFQFMGYTLEKGESSDYIYNVDYRSLKEDEEEEYFYFFSSSGWSHIASEGNIHLFRAYPGTKPIYSDRDTSIEKYENSNRSVKCLAIPLVLITVLVWIGAMISSGTLKSLLHVIAVILSVIATPTAWTVIATYNNKWKAKGKEGLVNLLKTIPFFLFLIAIITLLFVDGSDSVVRLLASMAIGAIALPTAIWVIMSLYHKMGGNRA
ncbi:MULTISPECIES: DUF2812 domain-containing protein [unclassified Bacillus (in: firmicutes)]|uniref:DUF2812 domain-containing protein n=1 Tax=unclassified Bacillus (in: firmicutes) TaxID=185979 RepID=UPI0008DF4F06|nr:MULTISPECIES: DUF2812 domain-containing protein [unclassified Bacillus (in: firmicutes)]SFJ98413.1 Protein of unknown function [Bacillus sp. 71mf]SFS96941.1 Protein of unknown function [Bacillus sp. 103mf]